MDQNDDGFTRQQWLAVVDRIKALAGPSIPIPRIIPREYAHWVTDPNNQNHLRFTVMDQGDELDQ